MNIMQCVIYARVSSKEQEKEGYSIPAQIDLLTNYAKNKGFEIAKIFSESETAKKAGRHAFNAMLEFIKEKSINIVLVEKTDRLYRNFKDYVTLEDYDLEIHLVKEGTVLSKSSKSHEKFIHGIKVLMAKNYIDNLSEEVKKGKLEKAKQGYYPFKAPVGYLNVKDETGKRIIIVDKEKAPFVKRAFELYASGAFSAFELRKKLFKEGFNHNLKPYTKTKLLSILKDIFYIGKFSYNGVIYEGKHEPIINIDLFNTVQKMFNVSRARTHNVEFTYSGLIKCGHCGCQLTAELKKGKYIYYHCTGKKGGNCKKDYIREELIDKEIMGLLEKLVPPEKIYNQIIEAVKAMQGVKRNYNENTLDNINKQIKSLQRRIEGLYLDKLDGKISEEFWEQKNNEWQTEKEKLSNQIHAMNNADKTFYEGSNLLLNFCKEAPRLYKSKPIKIKKQILSLLGSNFLYKDGKLSIELNSVFYNLLEIQKSTKNRVEWSKLELLRKNLTPEIYTKLKLLAA